MIYIILRVFIDPISTVLARFFECVNIVFIVYYFFKAKKTFKGLSRYASILVLLLFFWGIAIIMRGDWNVKGTKLMLNLIGNKGIMLYFLPLLFFLPLNNLVLGRILKLFFTTLLLCFPAWIINANQLIQSGDKYSYRTESIGVFLPFFAGFLLLLPNFFKRKEKLLMYLVFGIYFLLMLMNARRNVCLSFLNYGIMAVFVSFFVVNKRKASGNFMKVIAAAVISLILLLNLDSLFTGAFRYLDQRGTEDTRSGVETMFIYDFDSSGYQDWLFGRGMNGTYYQVMRDEETGEVETNRSVIETGYLDLVLRGGIIYDLLILLILIPAIFWGLLSKKLLGISCGLFLSTYLIDLYTTAPLSTIGVRQVLFWFCISICYRKMRFLGVSDIIGIRKTYASIL